MDFSAPIFLPLEFRDNSATGVSAPWRLCVSWGQWDKRRGAKTPRRRGKIMMQVEAPLENGRCLKSKRFVAHGVYRCRLFGKLLHLSMFGLQFAIFTISSGRRALRRGAKTPRRRDQILSWIENHGLQNQKSLLAEKWGQKNDRILLPQYFRLLSLGIITVQLKSSVMRRRPMAALSWHRPKRAILRERVIQI